MTKHEIGVLACRVLSIYTIISAVKTIYYIVFLVQPIEGVSTTWRIFASVVPFVLFATLGILLWVLADHIVVHMLAGTKASDSKVASLDIQSIAFSTVGLLVLADVIPRISQLIVRLSVKVHNAPLQELLSARTKVQAAGMVAQLAVGLGLFFGARGLIGILKAVREAGMREPDGG